MPLRMPEQPLERSPILAKRVMLFKPPGSLLAAIHSNLRPKKKNLSANTGPRTGRSVPVLGVVPHATALQKSP